MEPKLQFMRGNCSRMVSPANDGGRDASRTSTQLAWNAVTEDNTASLLYSLPGFGFYFSVGGYALERPKSHCSKSDAAQPDRALV